ncbi:MAG: type III pantothenate kinase [Phycisphaerales bacterium]
MQDGYDAVVLAVSVGNTRTTFGVYKDSERTAFGAVANSSFDELARALVERMKEIEGEGGVVVVASTNDGVAERVERALHGAGTVGTSRVVRIGRDIGAPLKHTLDDEGEKTVGQDRLLNAVAGFELAKQACVVISAGTALTVDFVDGEGVFHGGAIAPGVRMMLRAMHDQTSALPEVEWNGGEVEEDPEAPYGRNTASAMRMGAVHSVKGAVRSLTERYAEAYGAYPRVIATGGDAQGLFGEDDLVEAIVPDLTLRGIVRAWRAASVEEEA